MWSRAMASWGGSSVLAGYMLAQWAVPLIKNSREVRRDVLRDSQGVPGINGPVRKHYPFGADVIAAIILIGLSHGLRYLLSTHIVEVCTLSHMIPGRENTDQLCDRKKSVIIKEFLTQEGNQ